MSGGELVLASLGSLQSMGWPHPVLGQLGRFGFSGLVIAADFPIDIPPDPPLPVAVTIVPQQDVRHIEEVLAAAIARSRQQLYAFVQQLQRLVVDLAISGRGLEDVVRATSQTSGSRVLVQVGTRVLHRSPDRWLTSEDERDTLDGAEAVIGRREQPEGSCVVYSADGHRDEAELAAARCALACTIVLAREAPKSPISALLDPQYDANAVSTELRAADHDLDGEQYAVAISPAEGRMLGQFRRRWPRHMWHIHADCLFGLLSADDGNDLSRYIETLHPSVRVAVAGGGNGVAGAARSLERARSTLDLAGMLHLTRLSYQDVAAELTLRHIKAERAQEFAVDVLGPLIGDDRSLERETLLAYLDANRNAAAAASKLNVHRNTVLYRLRTIEPLLGRSLEAEGSTFDIYLALRLYRLFGGSATP